MSYTDSLFRQTPTSADADAFKALSKETLSAETHPNLFAWFCLVSKFSDAVKNSWAEATSAKGGKGGKKEDTKKEVKKEDDDDMDLFGDDDEEDAEAAKAAAEAAKAAAGKKKKKVVIAMSLVMLEVKPMDDTVNLDDLA